jgi:hypothetical protein
MKIIYVFLIAFPISSLMLSCSEETDFADLNIKYIDRLVVDGRITSEEKEQTILLYHSSDLSKADTSLPESGAVLSINDSEATHYLIEKQKGVYVTNADFAGKVNETYTLKIKLKNGTEYTASEYLYPSMILDTMYITPENEEYGIYIKAHTQGQGAAVIIDFYANDSLLTGNIKDMIIYAKGEIYEKVFSISDALINKDTTRIQLYMYSISYQMYQYINDIKNATIWSTEVFSATQSNARSNISNGGLGFFYASDVLKKQILIIKK